MNARRTFVVALTFGLLALSFGPSAALARRSGPSSAQIAAMKKQQQEQLQQQQNYQKAVQKRDAEVMARFDLNKNGKIDSNEKAPFDKYMRDIRLGKEPSPYASITAEEIKGTTADAKKTTTKK